MCADRKGARDGQFRGKRERASVRHQFRQAAFADMSAIQIAQRVNVSDLQNVFQAGRINTAVHGRVIDKLGDIGHVELEVFANGGKRHADRVVGAIQIATRVP